MHGRFRQSGLFRQLFKTVLQRCIDEGLVGVERFGVDAGLIPANANQTRGIGSKEGLSSDLTTRALRNISKRWMTRPSAHPPKSFLDKSHPTIPPRVERGLTAALHSSPSPPTIWWIWAMR
jgi:hypothetical protein